LLFTKAFFSSRKRKAWHKFIWNEFGRVSARRVTNRQDSRLAQPKAARSGRYMEVSAETRDVFHQ